MRLHLAQNEKIISRCIDNFEEVFPGDNKWIILPNNAHRDFIGEREKIIKCGYDTPLFREGVGDVAQYESIIVHFMTNEMASFVCSINHPKIYWIEWGADLYNVLLYYKGFQLYENEDTPKKYAKFKWLGPFYNIVHRAQLHRGQKLFLEAAKKVKYFVPDSMYDEYPLLLKYYPELQHLQYREFFYYPINEVLGDNYMGVYSTGSNIILGNSASLSGNHHEAIGIIAKLDLGNRKVITPLSYGLMEYGNDVDKYGRETLGDKYMPLREYMTLDKYNEVLRSANIFIYNNYRQEAVGNILVALYLGGKVFLNSKNPLLNFYRSLGLIIFSIDELTNEELLNPMTKLEIDNNRIILMKYYSRERLLGLIKTNF